MKQILILGAGVSGLSTGILLLKKDYKVIIWAKDFPPNTTSNKAAAVWYPFIAGPKEKVIKWGRQTLDYFFKEILPHKKSGVITSTVTEIFTHKKEDPWWKEGVDSFRHFDPSSLVSGYVDGYEIDGLVMDTGTYMDYLLSEFKNLGGIMIQKTIKNIQETFEEDSIVINCTGLGSRELFDDNTMYPCRGQTVKVKQNGFTTSIFEEEGPNSLGYIIPRIHDIVLGGTAQDNDWNTDPDPKDTEDILRKCSALRPEFKNAEIIGITVGLRPARPEIRLEEEYFGKNVVIHNYGHGGSGFTLSWGCSKEVVELVEKHIS